MNLAELFDSIDQARIDDYIKSQQEEHLLLDFKTITRSDLSSGDDRRNFAKALSGFANSSGGLVVWGVVARKLRPEGPDCASAPQEIEDLSTFLSRVNEFTGAFVRPIVDGVRHRAIRTTDDRGFAVTIVPESESGPHMALGGEGRYYKRSGSSFYPMEHFDIEDMFGRRRRPRLDVKTTVAARGSSRSGATVEHANPIAIFVVNAGRGSARNLFARVTVSPPYVVSSSGPEADGRGGLTRLSSDGARQVSLGGDPQLVIHPGMRQGITAVGFTYVVGQTLPDLQIELELAADDVPLAKSTHAIPWASIKAAIGDVE
jgi:hypothetical protein